MIVGYARSAPHESPDRLRAQADQLTAYGADRVAGERSLLRDAEILGRTIDALSSGDELVVIHLSAIVASAQDMIDVMGRLRAKGAALHVRSIGLTFDSKIRTTVDALLRSLSRAELDGLREAAAVAGPNESPSKRGRKASARAHAEQVIELAEQGVTRQAIADQLGIAIASVYRILRAAKQSTEGVGSSAASPAAAVRKPHASSARTRRAGKPDRS